MINTVGELKKFLETISDETPLHRSNNMGGYAVGIEFETMQLMQHKKEKDYFG